MREFKSERKKDVERGWRERLVLKSFLASLVSAATGHAAESRTVQLGTVVGWDVNISGRKACLCAVFKVS